jgi:hypothetical protein
VGGGVKFKPDAIAKLGDDIEHQVGEIIKQARYKLNGTPRDVESGSFTTFAFPLAVAYTEALSYADQDLIGKVKELMGYNDGLHKTAQKYRDAEHKSTLPK